MEKELGNKYSVDEAVILKENESCEGGTYSNAFNSRKVTDSVGLVIKKGIICCKSFHSRRCLMTYQLTYPEAELLVCPADVEGRLAYQRIWQRRRND